MKDIKVALQAEIEKMESACDEIPFGLDEEDEQCLWVMREALKQLARRDAQLAELAKQEPYAYTFESEAAELESLSGGMCRVWSANCYPDAPIKLYRAAPPARFMAKRPSLHVMIAALDMYDHHADECPEMGMLEAYKILLAESGVEVADE